jgi:type II secretory pathway component PulC
MKVPEPVQMQLPPKPIAPNVELARITGTDGHYSAVLRVNGDLKTYAVGDQVSSHETIKYISLSTVVLEDNGQPHTLHIKGVDAIYNAMR